MYSTTTHDIKITVTPTYLAEQSDPADQVYVWAYVIKMENQGHDTVQLINRHWHITDGNGQVHEVRGAGVVGKQPVLSPGGTFHYTSGVPLNTPTGLMQGNYEMRADDGRLFLIDIPAFSLDSAEQLKRAN